eukprot:jgi/Ulvmu1/2565/UM014_0016.1
MSQSIGGRVDVAAVVDELFFKDEHLLYLCHVGLNKTLTRTADGGSDAIRVKELADMVKHLRRAVHAYDKKLRQLQDQVNSSPDPPGSTAGLYHSQNMNAETQTSPGLSSQGTNAGCTEARPSKIPAPGAHDTEGLRSELRQTKKALEEAMQRYNELTQGAGMDAQDPAENVQGAVQLADAATSPLPPETTNVAVQALRLSARSLIEAAPAANLPPAAPSASDTEMTSLRAQLQALQEEVEALRLGSSRLQADLEDAAAGRKVAEAAAREAGVSLKQKDAELALVKATHDNDMQRKDDAIRKLQMTAEGHKQELQFEQDAVRELESKGKQANAKRAQLEREVASLKQKATQDVSGQGELWNTLRNKEKEHEAALKEKEAEMDHEKTISLKHQRTAEQLKRERDLANTEAQNKREEAELARGENKELNDRVLELTRQEVSLTQDIKDVRHELTTERAAMAAAAAAADARLKAADQRVEEAEARVAELDALWREACTARDEAHRRAEAAEGAKQAQGSKMQTLKAALEMSHGKCEALDTELSRAIMKLEEQEREQRDAHGAREAAAADLCAAQAAVHSERQRVEAEAAQRRVFQEKAELLESQMEALQEAVGFGDQKQVVGQLVGKVGHLETALAEAERQRRTLHNALVEIRGNIRVFCRLKPCSGTVAVAPIHGDGVRATVEGKPHDFFFDRVLGPGTTQEAAFSAVSDIVQSALDGYHVCLFSYGQTGSGKTYTMIGDTAAAGAAGRGVTPRAVSMILASATRLGAAGWEFRMEATFVEVYNEGLRDLLCEAGRGPGQSGGARMLDTAAIRHDPDAHTQIAGATRMLVDSEAVAQELLRRAARARSTDATAMNSESSRSHSVFTLHITGTNEAGGCRLLGSLSLVDLAGSERLARSGAEGQRQKETCAINKSLASLGDIFQALASKSTHIPYRNSKLTYLLQPALGGDGKTLMFVNINPEVPSAYESLCALRFAAKVNAVETAAAGRGGARRNIAGPADGGGGDSGAIVAVGGAALRRMSVAPGVARGQRQSVVPGGLPRAPLIPVKRNAPGGLSGPLSGGGGKERPPSGPRSSSLPAFKRRR